MLSNMRPGKGPCRTLLMTFLPSYNFTFAPMPYLFTSYLSMPESSLLCSGRLVSFKAFDKSLCQQLSGYPSELCQLGHVYPHGMTELCRELQEVLKTKRHFTQLLLTQIDFIYPGVH